MNFRIADTFSDSLGKLTAQEQKAVKTTAFDLQMDPANPGIQMHRIDKSPDKNFWSGRVNRDIRIILHRTGSSLMLCYVGHHDEAYAWAERRRIERHPKTGAAQLVEVREKVVEIPTYVADVAERDGEGPGGEPPEGVEIAEAREVAEPAAAAAPPLATVADERLLAYGVPPDWLEATRRADEDELLEIATILPGEAAEAVLALAVGEAPASRPAVGAPEADAFEHPDAQRRFRRIEAEEELERALEFPLERWAVYLHPQQRAVVEREYNGPARVVGSAGTGKTVVALHRAVRMARLNDTARVLLTTFSPELARQLQRSLRVLVREEREPRLAERINVRSMTEVAERLYRARGLGEVELASPQWARREIAAAREGLDQPRFTEAFLLAEWEHVVDAWQLRSLAEYQGVQRLGRKKRLAAGQREAIWQVFERLWVRLDEAGLLTEAMLFSRLAEHFARDDNKPYQYIVVDEAQDLSVSQLRFLAAVAGDDPEALFFAGDLGQRIFREPFSWLELGIDVRGRSHTLRLNYRTSHEIRQTIDRLLPDEIQDVDGLIEERRGTVSAFNGPAPRIETFASAEEEATAVAEWLGERLAEDIAPSEIGIFVRTEAQFGRAEQALEQAGLEHIALADSAPASGRVALGTMHDAKGLEFKAVAVIACDDDIVPLAARLVTAGETSDLDEIYNTERHLLYVAASRAREQLWVSGVEPGSEFLVDMCLGSEFGSSSPRMETP